MTKALHLHAIVGTVWQNVKCSSDLIIKMLNYLTFDQTWTFNE